MYTSVSTCVEVVLFAVELWNMKVRNLQYYILNSFQIEGLWNACSVLPWPPCILSYTITSLTGGTGLKPASMSEWFWLYTWDQASLLKLGQTSVIFVFYTGLRVCFMSVLTWSTFTHFMFYTCYRLSDKSVKFQQTRNFYTFVSGFMSKKSLKVHLSKVQFWNFMGATLWKKLFIF